MTRRIIVSLLFLLIVAVVSASILRDDGPAAKEVHAEPAEQRDIVRLVKASGSIRPKVQVNISAHVVAKILDLHVKEGDDVKKGVPFVDLEKEAVLASLDTQSAQMQMAQTEVEKAELRIQEARDKLKRLQKMAGAGAVAAEEVQSLEWELEQAQLDRARAQQSVRQARANLEKARDDVQKTTIFAPITGKVTALNAREGEVVVSGTMNNPGSVIGTVSDLSRIIAEVNVDETEIVEVEVDDRATIIIDAIPDREFVGKVVEVGSTGQQPQGTDVTVFQVKLLLDEADPRLRPGMSARAEIEVDRAEQATVVPIQSVVERVIEADDDASPTLADTTPPEESSGATETAKPSAQNTPADEEKNEEVVYVLEDGSAHRQTVEVGLSDETHVEITKGVEPGDVVITGPQRVLEDLEHGDAVEPSDESDISGDGGSEDSDDDAGGSDD